MEYFFLGMFVGHGNIKVEVCVEVTENYNRTDDIICS